MLSAKPVGVIPHQILTSPRGSRSRPRTDARQYLADLAPVGIRSALTSPAMVKAMPAGKFLGELLRAMNEGPKKRVAAVKQVLKNHSLGAMTVLMAQKSFDELFDRMGLASDEIQVWSEIGKELSARFANADMDKPWDQVVADLSDREIHTLCNKSDEALGKLDLASTCGMKDFIANFKLGAFEEKRALFEKTMSAYFGKKMMPFLKRRVLAGMLEVDISSCKNSDEVRLKRTAAAVAQGGSFLNKLFQKIGSGTEIPLLKSLMKDIKDNLPPMSLQDVNATIKAAVKGRIEIDFTKTKILKAASVGQTAIVTLKSGQKFVVKLLKPNAREISRWERQLMNSIKLNKVESAMVNDMFDTIAEEMDFRTEAANTEKALKVYSDQELRISVATLPYPELNSSDFLLEEFMEGAPIDTLESAQDLPFRAEALANFMRKWLVVALNTGFFHGDPHQGNIFAKREQITRAVPADEFFMDDAYLPMYEDETVDVVVTTPLDFGASGQMTEAEIVAAKWFGIGLFREDTDFIVESLKIIHGLDIETRKPGRRAAIEGAMKNGQLAMRDIFLALEKFELPMPRSFVLFFWSYDYLLKQIQAVNESLREVGGQEISVSWVRFQVIMDTIWSSPGRSAQDLYKIAGIMTGKMVDTLV